MLDRAGVMRHRASRARGFVAAALLCAGLASLPVAAQSRPPGPRLEGFWSSWLEEIEPLLTEEERLYFAILESDWARERFVEAFWKSRGDEALERWRRNGEDARRLRSRSRARERTVRLAGKPGSIRVIQRCGPLRRLEIWEWEPWHLRLQNGDSAEPHYLIFVEKTTLKMSSFEPWVPGDVAGLVRGAGSYDTVESVIEALDGEDCLGGDVLSRLGSALEEAISFDELRRLTRWPEVDSGWLESLARPAAEAHGLAADLRLRFPGAFTRYTILHAEIDVPVERLSQLLPGQVFDRVIITGDVFHNGRLADAFEIVHHVAGTAPGERVVLDLYRRLLPGPNRLHLRVADRYGFALLREDLELDVPEMDQPAPEPAGYSEGLSRLTRSDLVQLNTFPSVELLPAMMNAGGRMVVRAITAGGPIAAVEFRLAGASAGVDDEPPYTLDLEPVDAATRLTALALDPARRPLAGDERTLEPPNLPFNVRFGVVDPATTNAPVEVSLPHGARVERLECRHGRRLVDTSSAPPWQCPLPGASAGVAYVTARVLLESGDAQEDVMFLGPRTPEKVEVQLAELYLSVLGRGGRPARGLRLDDVRVWEAGAERAVVRLEPVDEVPLNIAVLMDISSSMGRSLRVAADSAQDFFERVLRPGDLASLLAFNHDLHRLTPFTGDSEALRYGATGLKAWGATRLHDAVAYALFQFSGLTSRRALIVLSDGSDVGSDFPLEQVEQFAVRAGVAVYTISLGRVEEVGAEGLAGLAAASGGRSFRVDRAGQLPETYRRIEAELRAQYLLVYQPAEPVGVELLPVEVEVLREGYRAREVRRSY